MTQQSANEQLSALMDGEIDSVSLEKLTPDETIRATWQRYHMISDIMHQRPVLSPHVDLTAKIANLLKNEPTVLAPTTHPIQAFLKPVAGVAVAASVAVMVVVGIQQYQSQAISPEQGPNIVVQSQTATPETTAVKQQPVVSRSAAIQPVQMEVQTSTRLNRYMMNHSEYQSNSSMHGVPHIRLVVTGVDE